MFKIFGHNDVIPIYKTFLNFYFQLSLLLWKHTLYSKYFFKNIPIIIFVKLFRLKRQKNYDKDKLMFTSNLFTYLIQTR